jgi:hypothetical protein
MDGPSLVWSSTGKAMFATPANEVDHQPRSAFGSVMTIAAQVCRYVVVVVVVAVDNLS